MSPLTIEASIRNCVNTICPSAVAYYIANVALSLKLSNQKLIHWLYFPDLTFYGHIPFVVPIRINVFPFMWKYLSFTARLFFFVCFIPIYFIFLSKLFWGAFGNWTRSWEWNFKNLSHLSTFSCLRAKKDIINTEDFLKNVWWLNKNVVQVLHSRLNSAIVFFYKRNKGRLVTLLLLRTHSRHTFNKSKNFFLRCQPPGDIRRQNILKNIVYAPMYLQSVSVFFSLDLIWAQVIQDFMRGLASWKLNRCFYE